MSFPRAGEYFSQFMLAILEVVKERKLTTDGKPKEDSQPKPPQKRKSWLTRVGDSAAFALFILLVTPSFWWNKFYAPLNTADRVLVYFVGREKRPGWWKMLRLRLKTWFWVNISLCVFNWFSEKHGNDPNSVKRGYDLAWRFIRDGLLCEGRPEKTFTDVFQFCTCKRGEYDWQYFDQMHGGIFTDDVRKVLVSILQFDSDSGKVFIDLYHEFTKDFPPEVKIFARDVKAHFLRNTGMQGLVDVIGREVRRFLGVYCDKMTSQSKKVKDIDAAQKWAHAAQALDQIRAKKPMAENDLEIERLVNEFVRRANEAGSFTFASRQIDVSPENGARLTSRTQGQIDEIASGIKRLVKDSKSKGEKNLKLSKATLKYVQTLWKREQHEPSHYPAANGRKVSKADVYGLYKGKLAEKGVMNYDDFCKAIDNGRKQAI